MFTDIDECLGVVCQNGGICLDGVNEFTCLCASGFEGTLCEHSKYICIAYQMLYVNQYLHLTVY